MFQLIAYDVATSWSCRDIHSSPLQSSIVALDVATSRCCRDISSSLLQPSTGSHDVATSLSCRDITLCLCRLHWLFLMSRPQFSVATSVFCRDIIPLIPAPSSAAYTVIPVATYIKFPSIFLMSRPQNWTVQTLNCINDSAS